MADEKFDIKIEVDAKDIKSLKKELKDLKRTGSKAASSISSSFKSIVGIITAKGAFGKMKAFLASTIQASNQIEQAMLKADAAARQFGISTETLRKNILDISKDGVLSIQQTTTAMQQLLGMGLSADEAFQFLEASKRISAFKNITGDAGQAVADFVKGLVTGSAELLENMDPSLRKVITSLGGYTKVAQDATARQKLMNYVINQGGKYQKDYNKYLQSGVASQKRFDQATRQALATIGDALQPVLSAVLTTLADLLNSFTRWFQSLGPGTKAVILIGSALAALVPTIAALLPMLGSLGAAFTAMLGPVGLAVAAIAGLTAAIAAVVNEQEQFKKAAELTRLLEDTENLTEEEKKRSKELRKQIDLYATLQEKEQLLTADARTRLAIYEQIEAKRQKAETLTDEAVKKIQKLRSDQRQLILFELKAALNQQKKKTVQNPFLQSVNPFESLEKIFKRHGIPVVRDVTGVISEEYLKQIERAFNITEQKIQRVTRAVRQSALGLFPFDEFTKQLAQIEREYNSFVIAVSRANKRVLRELAEITNIDLGSLKTRNDILRARELLIAQAQAEIAERRRKLIEEYVQSEKDATAEITNRRTEKIQEESKYLLDLIKDQERAQKLSAEEAALYRKQVELRAERDITQARLEGVAQYTSALESAANGIADTIKAAQQGNISKILQGSGGFLSGLGSLGGGLSALGPLGAAIGSIGGIIGAIRSIFEKDNREADERYQKQRDAEEKRHRETLRLMELQAKYQQELVEQGKRAEDLLDEQAERQIKLIDLQTKQQELQLRQQLNAGAITKAQFDEQLKQIQLQRSRSIEDVLKQRAEAKAKELGIPATPGFATTRLNYLSQKQFQTQNLLAAIQASINTRDPSYIQNALKNARLVDRNLRNQAIDLVRNLTLLNSTKNSLGQLGNLLVSGGRGGKILLGGVSASRKERSAAFRLLRFARSQGIDLESAFIQLPRGLARVPALDAQAVRDALANAFNRAIEHGTGTVNTIKNQLSILEGQLENGNELVSLLERQLDEQLNQEQLLSSIDDSTASMANSLKLQNDREKSFLDISLRRFISGGQFLQINPDALTLPEGVGSLSLSSTIQTATLSDSLAQLVQLHQKEVDLLAIIAANTDNLPETDASVGTNFLIQQLNNISRRSL